MKTKSQVQKSWATLSEHKSAEHIVYNILRKKDPSLGFTAIKKPNKITSCNNDDWDGYNSAVRSIKQTLDKSRWSYNEENSKRFQQVFGITFTEEFITELLNLKMK